MTITDELIARVEAELEGSRELDREIDLALNPGAELWSPGWYSGGKNEYLRWPDPKPGVAEYRQVERYTTSLDAALPGENIVIMSREDLSDGIRWVVHHEEPAHGLFRAWGKTEALARRAAALRGLQARQNAPTRPEDAPQASNAGD